MKNIHLLLIIILSITLVGCSEKTAQNEETSSSSEECISMLDGNSMTLDEAKKIALESECKEGDLKETHVCNENTGTWWIDLDINKEGCSPACVVNVTTKEAEINWRCTGLMQ